MISLRWCPQRFGQTDSRGQFACPEKVGDQHPHQSSFNWGRWSNRHQSGVPCRRQVSSNKRNKLPPIIFPTRVCGHSPGRLTSACHEVFPVKAGKTSLPFSGAVKASQVCDPVSTVRLLTAGWLPRLRGRRRWRADRAAPGGIAALQSGKSRGSYP